MRDPLALRRKRRYLNQLTQASSGSLHTCGTLGWLGGLLMTIQYLYLSSCRASIAAGTRSAWTNIVVKIHRLPRVRYNRVSLIISVGSGTIRGTG